MTPSLTGDWTQDLPYLMPALYHKDIEEAVNIFMMFYIKCSCLIDLLQRLKYRGQEVDSDLEDSFYLRRLEAGLFTLQLIDYILLEVSVTGPSSVSTDRLYPT